jgi:hypothetical protein
MLISIVDRLLRKLLNKGVSFTSEFVIAVNADIRGFTSFNETSDSKEAALFISKVYKKLISEYFPKNFFKLTGDGLLVVVPCHEKQKTNVV